MKWVQKSFDELTTTELYGILRLRTEIFVVEQDCVYQDIDNKDQKAHHIFAVDQNEIVAYARIFKAGDYFQEASIGRVIVSDKRRGKGLARSMMLQAIAYITEHFETKSIRISAQTYLEEFYAGLGFKAVGMSYLEDGLPHIGMVRN
jgi:ElaA protein